MKSTNPTISNNLQKPTAAQNSPMNLGRRGQQLWEARHQLVEKQ
jgi:hypothetical protein